MGRSNRKMPGQAGQKDLWTETPPPRPHVLPTSLKHWGQGLLLTHACAHYFHSALINAPWLIPRSFWAIGTSVPMALSQERHAWRMAQKAKEVVIQRGRTESACSAGAQSCYISSHPLPWKSAPFSSSFHPTVPFLHPHLVHSTLKWTYVCQARLRRPTQAQPLPQWAFLLISGSNGGDCVLQGTFNNVWRHFLAVTMGQRGEGVLLVASG